MIGAISKSLKSASKVAVRTTAKGLKKAGVSKAGRRAAITGVAGAGVDGAGAYGMAGKKEAPTTLGSRISQAFGKTSVGKMFTGNKATQEEGSDAVEKGDASGLRISKQTLNVLQDIDTDLKEVLEALTGQKQREEAAAEEAETEDAASKVGADGGESPKVTKFGKFSGLITGLLASVVMLAMPIYNLIKDVLGAIKDMGKNIFEFFKVKILPILTKDIPNFFVTTIPDFFMKVLPDAFNEGINLLKTKFKDILDGISNITASIKETIGQWISDLADSDAAKFLLSDSVRAGIKSFGQDIAKSGTATKKELAEKASKAAAAAKAPAPAPVAKSTEAPMAAPVAAPEAAPAAAQIAAAAPEVTAEPISKETPTKEDTSSADYHARGLGVKRQLVAVDQRGKSAGTSLTQVDANAESNRMGALQFMKRSLGIMPPDPKKPGSGFTDMSDGNKKLSEEEVRNRISAAGKNPNTIISLLNDTSKGGGSIDSSSGNLNTMTGGAISGGNSSAGGAAAPSGPAPGVEASLLGSSAPASSGGGGGGGAGASLAKASVSGDAAAPAPSMGGGGSSPVPASKSGQGAAVSTASMAASAPESPPSQAPSPASKSSDARKSQDPTNLVGNVHDVNPNLGNIANLWYHNSALLA